MAIAESRSAHTLAHGRLGRWQAAPIQISLPARRGLLRLDSRTNLHSRRGDGFVGHIHAWKNPAVDSGEGDRLQSLVVGAGKVSKVAGATAMMIAPVPLALPYALFLNADKRRWTQIFLKILPEKKQKVLFSAFICVLILRV
jgi:hypothetical protein